MTMIDAATTAHRSPTARCVSSTVSSTRWSGPNVVARKIVSSGQRRGLEQGRVLQELAAEDRPLLVRRLDREEQVEERECHEAHRVGDGFVVVVDRPDDDSEGPAPMAMPDDRQPEEQRPRQDRLILGPRRLLHQAFARLAVARPMAWKMSTVKLIHRVWSGRNGTPPRMLKMLAPRNVLMNPKRHAIWKRM